MMSDDRWKVRCFVLDYDGDDGAHLREIRPASCFGRGFYLSGS